MSETKIFRDFYLVLVGEQTLPNLIPAMAIEPREWWFVYSEDRFKNQEIEWCKRFWCEYRPASNARVRLIHVDPYSPENVKTAITNTWQSAKQPKGFVNVTGGTKLMSMGAYEFGLQTGQMLGYYHGGKLFSLNPQVKFNAEKLAMPELSPRQLLMAYGKNLDPQGSDITPSPEFIEFAYQMGKFPAAATVFSYWLKSSLGDQKIKPPPELYNPADEKKAMKLLELGEKLKLLSFYEKNGIPVIRPCNEALNNNSFGKWLEIYVGDIAKRILGEKAVLVSQRLLWDNWPNTSITNGELPKTEVDILAAKSNQLHFFSCKTDGQGKTQTLSKELNEIDSTARALGGALTRKALITNADLSTKRDLHLKAKIMRIDLIDRHDLPNLEQHLFK